MACYAGIERCIRRKIPLFEAGAQGEHKLLRGFMPARTHSCHWFAHPGLARAVRMAVQQEEVATLHRMAKMAEFGPFRSAPSSS